MGARQGLGFLILQKSEGKEDTSILQVGSASLKDKHRYHSSLSLESMGIRLVFKKTEYFLKGSKSFVIYMDCKLIPSSRKEIIM